MSTASAVVSGYDPLLGKLVSDSTDSGWTSLHLSYYIYKDVCTEPFTTTENCDQTILVLLKGNQEIEKIDGRNKTRSRLVQGFVGLTPSNQADTLMYRSKNEISAAKISIPLSIVDETRDYLRQIGQINAAKRLNALGFVDQTIFQVAISLIEGLRLGAPNLYAESAAQWLISHLFTAGKFDIRHYEVPFFSDKLQDRRVNRAIEMMRSHLGDQISLAHIAEEAGISRFHVTRVFREKTGYTPYKLLIELRLQKASSMLRNTDLSIQAIAFQCGFRRPADFSTTFRHRYRCSPSEWRRQCR